MNTPNGYNQIRQMFGNPANDDGSLNQAWYHANIITVPPPPGWRLYYQNAPDSLVLIAGISMHRLLADSFLVILQQIWDYAKQQIAAPATDDAIRAWLHKNCLDQTGGGYNFRKSKGSTTKLSLHSFGIAIDWDPLHNPRKKPMSKTLPDWWYAIWAQHGWTDGKHFTTPDPMHVQFATGA
jgi:hypothetical protein